MKLLLDECLPVDFRHSFSKHDCHTVQSAGFKGKKNGALLRAAGYEVLVTVDHGIPHERPSLVKRLSIVVIRSRTNQIEDLASALSELYSTVPR